MDPATACASHRKRKRYVGQQGIASVDDDDDALAVFRFHESRGGVRALVESGVTTVPPLFLAPTTPAVSSAAMNFVVPSVDLSLPRSDAVALVRAAARSSGIFQVTNHGVPAATVDSALSVVRAFNEQPFAARSPFYSVSPIGAVTYATIPIPRPRDGQPVTTPLLSWRDSLILRFDHPGDPDLRNLPAACRDSLLEYHRSLTRLGKEIAGLLLEGLGVGAERLEQIDGFLMQCHYHPPCPEPERALGSREHTDGDLFTVVSQDGVGGLQVRLDSGEWVDVAPVAGTLLVNIGDFLKVVSNDEYKSVEHRVVIKSAQEPRVSIALFFNPAKHGRSDFFGPLPELVTEEKPARYRSLSWQQMLNNRIALGHAKPSALDQFRVTLN
ncbi:hypothetical protein GQ55_5G294300 [Panicum hallii var. hallii]|uniref:Fe2OG dioxygenase domain-containing protein n=1 Tax=Panicum hallii var. hallii TaxID=1504633 RepID=A0A2T7DLD1_9POAL|nr:hypothetical protein GQ55_5G294300 [Panicum hallii var. hallii]